MLLEEIFELPAGEQLDELIAEKILPEYQGYSRYGRFNPSTEVSWAFEVMKKLAKEPYAWSIESVNTSDGVLWNVIFWGDGALPGTIFDYTNTSPSLSLSISRVALATVLGVIEI